MKIKSLFRKIFNPVGLKLEQMEKFWIERPKTIRIEVEFENGIVRELNGDDAETYAKSMYWIQNGFISRWDDVKKLVWKNVVKN